MSIAQQAESMVALRIFSDLPDDAMVRAPVPEMLFGISTDTRDRYIKKGLIPSPRKVGRTNLWNVGELRAALASMKTEAA